MFLNALSPIAFKYHHSCVEDNTNMHYVMHFKPMYHKVPSSCNQCAFMDRIYGQGVYQCVAIISSRTYAVTALL